MMPIRIIPIHFIFKSHVQFQVTWHQTRVICLALCRVTEATGNYKCKNRPANYADYQKICQI